MIEKVLRINALYDFYQPLLTRRQQEYLDLYYLNDFSLGEIAERCGVSRQAVYDNLKRAESALESLEEKLQLCRKYEARRQVMTLLREQTAGLGKNERERFDLLLGQLENLD
ncbi:MAG: putative DNA-binding protein [Sporolactobacillus sp.]